MINSVYLHNFKGHRDTTVPLGRLTLLVGANGAGKTSVLEALWLQSEVARGASRSWDPADLLRRGAPWPIVLESSGTRGGTAWKSHVEIGSAGASAGAPEMRPVRLYKLNADRIAAAAYSDRPGAEIERDGTNTAVALAAIKLGNDEAFMRIETDMRRLVPTVERVRIRQALVSRMSPTRPGAWENPVGSKIYFDLRGASGVPAHAASEGTLVLLALLTVLHGPNRPDALLLDDFDQSLHPEAQLELVRLIKALLEEFPELQVVATTHSPYILDELDPADVHAFALRDDGTVAVKRLSEHPEAEKMKGALSAGQLWSLDPERKWVLAEKAA